MPFCDEEKCTDTVCDEVRRILSGTAGVVLSWECILMDEAHRTRRVNWLMTGPSAIPLFEPFTFFPTAAGFRLA